MVTKSSKRKVSKTSSQSSSAKQKSTDSHPFFKQQLTPAQRAADALSKFAGSWGFILGFLVFLVLWMVLNVWLYTRDASFDPYPFILLNLVLSCLAALQAPVILMSQNRQAERDRQDAKYDYKVNRQAEREIKQLQKDLARIERLLRSKL